MRATEFDADFFKGLKGDSRVFQVSYRIAEDATAEGSRDERYEAITSKLQALPAATQDDSFDNGGHVSTSTWMVEGEGDDADALLSKLAMGLTAGRDILRVIEVVPDTLRSLT